MDGTDPIRDRAGADPDGLALLDPPVTWAELDRSTSEKASGPLGRLSIETVPGVDAVVALHAARRAGVPFEPLAPGQPPSDTEAPQGTWTLMRTSGSTGEPKPVALTVANHDASAMASERHLDLTPDDRWLACLPFHHVGGLGIFVRSAFTGFGVVPVWPFRPEAVIAAARLHEITAMSVVPTMLARLLASGWRSPESLRFVLLGGAPCPPLLLQEALDRGIPVAPTYGMTETCSQVATLLPDEVPDHFGSAGRALPDVELRTQEDGRVAVRGGMVSPQAAAADGWLLTNDIGVIDDGGYLSIIGRADEAIVTGGEKVIPRTVEEILEEDPSVAESAVVGVPDEGWGERVVAAVTARPGTGPDPESLRGALRERLPAHMVPKAVIVLDELPRTGPGKVDRARLRMMLAEATR